MTPSSTPRTALVLSGGGARGAYQVGVVAGILEVLGAHPSPRRPFDLYFGMSAGALNASYLASHGDDDTLGLGGLIEHWSGLRLRHDIRLALCRGQEITRGRSLFATEPVERLLSPPEGWRRLHRNIDEGIVGGLIVPALHVPSGRTTVFAELAPGITLRPWPGERRLKLVVGRLTADHLLASLAIPALFPARLVGGEPYCDGGLRMCAPLAPVLRAGATRLVVITLRSEGEGCGLAPPRPGLSELGHPLFLAGKVLDGLLLDPVDHDIELLLRMNRLATILEGALDPATHARVDHLVEEKRGAPYRRIELLQFSPSKPLALVVLEALESLARGPPSAVHFLRELARRAAAEDADLLSFLLFDGAFTRLLIDLGRRDALARAAEVAAFFGPAKAELA